MGFFGDMKVLYHMAVRPVRGENHAQRMENFYGGQAGDYDSFRKRLLRGRQELWDMLEVPEGGIWVDMGGGTGSNLEYFGETIERLRKVYVVDLAESLLEVARRRAEERKWNNVHAVAADATTFRPAEGKVDVVTFSYSLTMIPDWFAAVENALAMLKPGGKIGVVDFYVSRKHPEASLRRHGWATRSFWPVWFAGDNVFPSADHLPFLRRLFNTREVRENKARVPYFPVPCFKVPYYQFVGEKSEEAADGPTGENS